MVAGFPKLQTFIHYCNWSSYAFFVFQGQFYQQMFGAPLDSHFSAVCNYILGSFRISGIRLKHPRVAFLVDDKFIDAPQNRNRIDSFLDQPNKKQPKIN